MRLNDDLSRPDDVGEVDQSGVRRRSGSVVASVGGTATPDASDRTPVIEIALTATPLAMPVGAARISMTRVSTRSAR